MLYLTAKDIMTRDVVTVRKGTSIDGAARLMAKHEISGLPVLDADGYLVGMITESDIILKGMHGAGIAAAMIEHAINRVPIIEGRKVVGIVSRKDVVKAIAAGTGDYYDPDRHVGRTLKL